TVAGGVVGGVLRVRKHPTTLAAGPAYGAGLLPPLQSGSAGARSNRSSGLIAGPCMTSPPVSNREPWQGQSQLLSASFQLTTQPRCVHAAERRVSSPWSSR